MTQQGDIFLFQANNHGDITVENGVIEMTGGLDTAAFLSLFGGNENCSGRDTCPFSWWGNFDEIDKANKYISETQFLLKTLPAITANLRRIEDAAIRDLSWFLDKKIASSVTVAVTIPALNAIKINVIIEANGIESNFNFVENWKATTITTDELESSPFVNVGEVIEWSVGDSMEWIDGENVQWS